MAGKTAILSVRVVTDTKQAVQGLDQVASKTQQFESGLKQAALPAAAVGTAIGVMGKQALDAASALQQSAGGVEAVFGASAAQMQQWADTAATSVGLSKNSYNEMATVLGSQLKNMGLPLDQVAGKTNDLITLGADLAAQFGGSTSDAVSALSALFRGEGDPIERYGVSIKQSDVNARMAAMGLTGLTGAAAKNADMQARLSLLTEQTASAHGAFGRESDTAAHAQQVAAAQWEDAAASLGAVLLPVATFASQVMGGLAQFTQDNSTATGIFIGVIGALVGAVLLANGAIAAYRTMVTVATAVQWLWNIAMSANPIMLIITAIGLLIFNIVLLSTHFDQIKWKAAEVWGAIIGWIQDAINAVGRFFGAGGNLVNWTGNASMSSTSSFTATAATAGTNPLMRMLTNSAAPPVYQSVYNINVHGAIDKEGTASTIRSTIRDADRTSGRGFSGGNWRK